MLYKYKYYDTPEGHDIYKKIFVTSKYAGAAGVGFATFDVLMLSQPKGFFNTAYRYAFIAGPLVGMAAAFTVTANGLQNYRGKNDKYNYFFGGVASGVILGAWQKSALVAVPACIVLGAVAVVKKMSVDENWTFFPHVNMATKTIQSVRHDWTLVKDLDELKTWTDVGKTSSPPGVKPYLSPINTLTNKFKVKVYKIRSLECK